MKLLLSLAAGLAVLLPSSVLAQTPASPAPASTDAVLPIKIPSDWHKLPFNVMPEFKFVWRKDGAAGMPSLQMRIVNAPGMTLATAVESTRTAVKTMAGGAPIVDEPVSECGQAGQHVVYTISVNDAKAVADETIFVTDGHMYSRSYYHAPGDVDAAILAHLKTICPQGIGPVPAGWHEDPSATGTKMLGMWLGTLPGAMINVVVMPYTGDIAALQKSVNNLVNLGTMKLKVDQKAATFCGQPGSKGTFTGAVAGLNMELQQEIGIRDGTAYVVTYNHPAGKDDPAGTAAFDSFCPPPKG